MLLQKYTEIFTVILTIIYSEIIMSTICGLYSKLYSCIAVTLAHNGDFEESDRYIKLAGQTALNASDSITLFMKSSEIAYIRCEYKTAYDLFERGALLDVTQKEPLEKNSPLYDIGRDKLLITNHSVGFTPLIEPLCYDRIIENIEHFLKEGKPKHIVNIKEQY